MGQFYRLLISSVLLGRGLSERWLCDQCGPAERGTAAAVAIGVWLLFVLLYDMGLLALLASDGGDALNGSVVKWLMLFNPTDSYRMFNLTSSEATALLSGMSGLNADNRASDTSLILMMLAWLCGR